MADISLSDFFPEVWNTAAGVNADNSYSQPRGAATVPTNALQTMQPIESTGTGAWADWLQGTVSQVLGYAVAKDAAQSGLTAAGYAPQQQQPVYVQQPAAGGMARYMPLLMIGGAVLVGGLVLSKVMK